MTFQIIQHRGDPQQAALPKHNIIVKRQERLFVGEWGQFVTCAPYDNHFVYQNPDRTPGQSSFMCTCGSPAVVATPFGARLFVCLNHATYGFHTTAQVNKVDFENKDIVIKKGRKWA